MLMSRFWEQNLDNIREQLLMMGGLTERTLTRAAEMMETPRNITRALHLLTIVKALERVADHATNIAQEAFYLCKGEDIRHGKALKTSPD